MSERPDSGAYITEFQKQCETAFLTASMYKLWISVDDSLPEPGKRVLVCREGFFKGDKIIDIDVRIHTNSARTDTEWADNLRSWKSVVTHWMPLPEFPEVKKG